MPAPDNIGTPSGEGGCLSPMLAVQEGTYDRTPFPLSYCHVSSDHLNRLKGGMSAVGKHQPVFHMLNPQGTIFWPCL